MKATHTPPFRLHGTQATVFYRTPSAKSDADGEISRHLLYRKQGECQIKFRKSFLLSSYLACGRLDIFRKLGYNKNTRRCLPLTSIPLRWNPRRLPQHMTYGFEALGLKDNEPLCCEQTAHFFLSYRYSTRDTMLAMEPRAPRTAKIVEVICIASFGIDSREGYAHASIPPSRDAGNRLLPYTVCKKRRGR